MPINYYIKTNTTGLRGMVDLVGGVYMVVDKNMHYTDRHGGLHINLKASPEKQLLNGKQAEGFVRFRHDAIGDSGYRIKDGKKVPAGRIVRQQYLHEGACEPHSQLCRPSASGREFLQTAYERQYIVSDLNLKDWDGLSDFFKDIKPEQIKMAVLPGAPGMVGRGSYWIPDATEIAEGVAVSLLFQDPPPKVEVLNGSGWRAPRRRWPTSSSTPGSRSPGRTTRRSRTTTSPRSSRTRARPSPSCASPGSSAAMISSRTETAKTAVDVTVIVGRSQAN